MKETRNLKKLILGQKEYSEAKLEINENFDKKTKRINGFWTIIERDGTRVKLPNYSVRIYTQKEFFELCKKVGFSKIKFVGDWKEKFNPNKHQELIVFL